MNYLTRFYRWRWHSLLRQRERLNEKIHYARVRAFPNSKRLAKPVEPQTTEKTA